MVLIEEQCESLSTIQRSQLKVDTILKGLPCMSFQLLHVAEN